MNEALEALKAFLSPLSYETFIVWAFSPAPRQYVVLGGKSWDDPSELPLCGLSDSFDTEIRIRAVTGTPEGAMVMLAAIKNRLSPNRVQTRVPQTGRDLRISYVRSEFVDVDQDTVITATGRHPAFGVDSYRFTSQPL